MPQAEWLAAVPEENRRYWLEQMPNYLLTAGQADRLYKLLTWHDFLQAKADTMGIESLLEDYARAKNLAGIAENLALQRIADALRAGVVRLGQEPEELWNQVKGRANFALHVSHPRPVPRLDFRCASLMPADPELLYILQGHLGDVTACALSADGKTALSASVDGTFYMWDTTRGEAVRVLQGQAGTVTACALSANGQVALSGDRDGMLRLWNTERGVTLHTWSFPSAEVERCSLSADGKLALVLNSPNFGESFWNTSRVQLWDTEHGKILYIWKFPIFWEVADCALSADGRRVLTVSNLMGLRAKLEVWDAASGRRIRKLKGFKGVVGSCALSADGHIAISGSRTAYLGTMIENKAERSWLLAIISAFWVFDNFEGSTLRVWDTSSGKTQRILQGHKDSVAICALSADGKLALSASSKLVEDDISLADPSGHWVLRLWNTASKEALYTQERYASPIHGCVLSEIGHQALTFAKGDTRLRLWDTKSGQILHILKHRQAVASCALSADGRLALSVSYDARLRLWDTESGKVLRSWMYHPIGIKDCTLSADGRWALSLRVDGFLYLWDTISGKTLTQFLPEEKPDEGYRRWTFNFAGGGFALSADGNRALFVSKDGALQIWNRGDFYEPSILEESRNNVDSWALSANGKRVLAVSKDGKTLRVWNTESGRILHTLVGHTGLVPGCSLSANGRLALSASWDRTLRLWDTDNGQEITRWTHDIQLSSCTLSADGRVAVAGDIEGGVHFLEVMGVAKDEDIAAVPLSDENIHISKQTLQHAVPLKEEPEEISEKRNTERFDKFTGQARTVLSLAQKEARSFQHNYIGTEHLLLGLLRDGEGVAAKILSNLGVELSKIRAAVEFIIGRGDRIVLGEFGLTPRAKKVIELAVDEARRLNHYYIGTEHLLLGLVREGEGIAAGVLESLGVDLEKVRTQTIHMLNQSKIEEEVRALESREQQLRLEHPNVAFSLTRLAELYTDQAMYTEAEALYQRALHIWERQLGPEHRKVATPLIGLATLYYDQGKYTEAESLYQQALHIWEQQLGPEHPNVSYPLNNLAELHADQGKYTEAESLYQQALRIREQQWGPEHPNVAETMHDLARLREAQGRSEEARAWYTKALTIYEQTLGAQHPKTMETRKRLIALLHTLGQHEQAAQLETAQADQAAGEQGRKEHPEE